VAARRSQSPHLLFSSPLPFFPEGVHLGERRFWSRREGTGVRLLLLLRRSRLFMPSAENQDNGVAGDAHPRPVEFCSPPASLFSFFRIGAGRKGTFIAALAFCLPPPHPPSPVHKGERSWGRAPLSSFPFFLPQSI